MVRHHHFKPPKYKHLRKKMPAKCFLKPTSLKYPVCELRTKKPSCDGALAARRRAILNKDHAIAAAAKRLGKKLGCNWAK